MPKDENLSFGTYRFEQKKNAPVFQSETFDVHNMLIEKNGTGRLTMNENGVTLSIPRQKYEPQMVYISFLKMAYTLLPTNEIPNYLKGILGLYHYISMSPFYNENGNQRDKTANENERKEYINSLPNIGLEITLSNTLVKNGVNVCLLQKATETDIEPKLLFAIQMKWYTIVIPVLSDDCVHENLCSFTCLKNENISVRKLDFTKVEELFLCNMDATEIEIPKELYKELEDDLRNNKLLKK